MPTVLFRLRPCPAAAKHHSHVKLLQPCADAKWHGAMKIQQWPLRHVGSVKLAWFCSHLYFYISKIWQLFHVPSMITITIKLQNDITSSCHITSETCNSQITLFIYVRFLFNAIFFSFYIYEDYYMYENVQSVFSYEIWGYSSLFCICSHHHIATAESV